MNKLVKDALILDFRGSRKIDGARQTHARRGQRSRHRQLYL